MQSYFPDYKEIVAAYGRVHEVARLTPCWNSMHISDSMGCNLFLKREDFQEVRSYKIRGSYNKIASLSPEELVGGVVCASAGNHAQGVAFSCSYKGCRGKIFLPETTPAQKIEAVRYFGKDKIEVVMAGRTFDEANAAALAYARENGAAFIPPFDDPKVIEGQGTVAVEILRQMGEYDIVPDYILVPIGGGGLASGVGAYIKSVSARTKVIGVEPEGAASMKAAFESGGPVTLDAMNTFVDGCAVQRVGNYTYGICREVLDDIVTIPEGVVCRELVSMFNMIGAVMEPAGVLSLCAVIKMPERFRNKNVCCIVSGSNNDALRMETIIRMAGEYSE